MTDVFRSKTDRAFMEKLEILAGKLWITEGEKYGEPDARFDIRQPSGCAPWIYIDRYLAFRVTVNELFAGLVSVPLKLTVPVVASEPA
jgi:hypothetical protein